MISRDKQFPAFTYELPRPKHVRAIPMEGKATSSQLPPSLYSPRVRSARGRPGGNSAAMSSPRRGADKKELTPAPRRVVKMSVAELLKGGSIAVRLRRELAEVVEVHGGVISSTFGGGGREELQLMSQLLRGFSRACTNDFCMLATEQFAPVLRDIASVSDRRVSSRIFKLLDDSDGGMVESKGFLLHVMKLCPPLPESTAAAAASAPGQSPRRGAKAPRSPRARAAAAAQLRAKAKLPPLLEQKCLTLHHVLHGVQQDNMVCTTELRDALKREAELELQYLLYVKELLICMAEKSAQLAEQKAANARRLLGTTGGADEQKAPMSLPWEEIHSVAKREPLVHRTLYRCFEVEPELESLLQELQRQSVEHKSSKSMMAQMGMATNSDNAAVVFEWKLLLQLWRHAERFMAGERRTLVDKALWCQLLGEFFDEGMEQGAHPYASHLDPERRATMAAVFDFALTGSQHTLSAAGTLVPWRELLCQVSKGVRKHPRKGRRQDTACAARLEFYAAVHDPAVSERADAARPATAASRPSTAASTMHANPSGIVMQLDLVTLLDRAIDTLHSRTADLNQAMQDLCLEYVRIDMGKWLRAVTMQPAIRAGVTYLL